MNTLNLKAEAMTRERFAPFGDVVETRGAKHFGINEGTIERYHDLARVDVGVEQQGRALISIACANVSTTLPHEITLVERHPLGTQAFIPMDDTPVVIVVAPAGEKVNPSACRAFVTNGSQGINYRRGIWHMPLIALRAGQRFVVVDRGGPGDNCEEYHFRSDRIVVDL